MSKHFGADAAASYLNGPPRQVPGFESMHRMVEMLLAERIPTDGQILVLGAGGGLELRFLAEAQPAWTFHGVDPSEEMLALAAETVDPHRRRVAFHHGYIDTASEGPFDGAVSLLTFHFIPRDERLNTLRQLRSRLRKGAPLVLVHISFPQDEPNRSLWIQRHVAYGGTPPEHVERARQAIGTRLSILDPEEEGAMLERAGFSGIQLFYAGLSFRGWVAYAD